MAGVTPQPPRAGRRPHTHRQHGVAREDPYYWLREREDPEVVAYIKAENAYTKVAMAGCEALQETLFEEIKGRIKQDDDTYPVRWKSFLYYSRFGEGSEYPVFYRRRAADATEEVMLDVPAMAAGHEFYDLDEGDISPNENLLAYAFDIEGRGICTLCIRDLVTGKDLDEVITAVDGGHAWSADSATLFYSKQDPQTLRSHQIWRHRLGTAVATDVLVYEEGDEAFETGVSGSKSGAYIVIGSSQTLSDEFRLLDASRPEGEFAVMTPRRRGLEYDIEHYREGFYILTNKGAPNFQLMWAAQGATAEEDWEVVVPGRDDVFLSDFEIFDGFVVTVEREGGLDKLRVRPMAGGGVHTVDFGEPAYSVWADGNLQFDSRWLRFAFHSPKTPPSLYEVDLLSGEKRLLKRQPVLGGYDSDNYATERIEVVARDGQRVPLTVIYRVDRFEKGAGAPLLLEGYGAYGISSHAGFDSTRVSLLDRGFACAIAHVRGGQELGRRWYEDGKLLKKRNTFDDFIDCAEFLLAEGYTSRAGLCASGGSAGGLLMGVVANERPDLFAALVADVPFVDVVTTMSDRGIPLTEGEYDEWGDPADRVFFDYMLAYSPYDNVRAGEYPAMLVVAGWNDSQVQYWEPAKWVARLRHRKTGDSTLLLRTDMEAGHGGASGRFESCRESALAQAFLLQAVGAAR